jgi:hypothetical protein
VELGPFEKITFLTLDPLVLNEMQSIITSADKEFDGNWVSVFIRLGPKEKRQMLITL